jgi:6-phosphogluconolactonase
VLVVITGDKKRQLLEKALDDGPLSDVPIGRVLADVSVPVDIHWRR